MKTVIVGPGRVGKTLALVHRRAGDEVVLLGRRAGPWQDWAAGNDIAPAVAHDGMNGGEALLFAVPDPFLHEVCAKHAVSWKAQSDLRLVVHTSGLHGLDVFRGFREQGRTFAALHPILPFAQPEQSAVALSSAWVTLLSHEPKSDALSRLLGTWQCRVHPLAETVDRSRYHLGLSLAANHLTAIMGWAEQLLQPALGTHALEVACSLAEHALRTTQATGAAAALTGPVVRGDTRTLRAHYDGLSSEDRAVYLALLEKVLQLAQQSPQFSGASRDAIREFIRKSKDSSGP